MCSTSPVETPKYNSLLYNQQQENIGSHQKRYPHPSAREKPQQDSRKGEIVFRIKPYTYQRNSECSNKTLCNQETPQGLARPTFECLSVSYGGTGQQWPAAVAGALGAAVLGVA